MKRNFKITLQYEGTRYRGWQKQGNTDNTVQARVERALENLCGAPVEARGSGRTDAGVHALGQVVSAAMDTDLTPQEVRDGLNAHLPADIAAVDCEERDLRFHARLNARRKTYRYRIHQGPVPDVFGRRWAWDCPETLDLAAMEQAAAKLMGERDFQSFCDLKNSKKSTVRRLERIDLRREGDDILLDLTGNGFLYHMVRILAGTLAEVGAHRLLPGQMEDILASHDRKNAGPLAPAQGLTLVSVEY